MESRFSDPKSGPPHQPGTTRHSRPPSHVGARALAAALVATGRLQGVEMHRQSDNMHWEYYRSLNAGYRLPLLGGTDKIEAGAGDVFVIETPGGGGYGTAED